MTPDRSVIVDHQAYTRGQMAPELYISADIEADGPIPGKYSMLAFGLAVAGGFDGRYFEGREPSAATFYRELQPISDNVVASAACVAALDRDRLKQEGTPPAEAMSDAARWVEDQASSDHAVLVGYPVVFDCSSCKAFEDVRRVVVAEGELLVEPDRPRRSSTSLSGAAYGSSSWAATRTSKSRRGSRWVSPALYAGASATARWWPPSRATC
jgi:hypothetical protein